MQLLTRLSMRMRGTLLEPLAAYHLLLRASGQLIVVSVDKLSMTWRCCLCQQQPHGSDMKFHLILFRPRSLNFDTRDKGEQSTPRCTPTSRGANNGTKFCQAEVGIIICYCLALRKSASQADSSHNRVPGCCGDGSLGATLSGQERLNRGQGLGLA